MEISHLLWFLVTVQRLQADARFTLSHFPRMRESIGVSIAGGGQEGGRGWE